MVFVCLSIKASSFPISNKNSLFSGWNLLLKAKKSKQIAYVEYVTSWPTTSAERWCDPQKVFRSTLRKFHRTKQKRILFLFGRRDNIKRTKQQKKSAINFVLFHRGERKKALRKVKDKSTRDSFRFLRFDYGNWVNYLLHLLRD